MSEAMKLAMCSMECLYPKTTPTRNLGSAIVLTAIADYRGQDEQEHLDAALFLYPTNEAARGHYEWAVALNDLVDAAWLRESLDRSRAGWDADREKASKGQRSQDNEKRMGLGERRLHDRDTRSAGANSEPACAASLAGIDAVAASV